MAVAGLTSLFSAWAGEAGGYSPSELRVFTNRDDLDFGTAADLPPVQQWDLAENLRGDIELPCNVSYPHVVCRRA